MKFKIILFCLFSLLLISCTQKLNYKEVEIIINSEHPFEKTTNKQMWYTISYTDGFGNIKYYHLGKDQRKIKIYVKKDMQTFICAKALDTFSPIAGVISPNDNKVVLDYENGFLVEYLQNLYLQNPNAICSIKYEKLFSILKQKGLLYSFNEIILARDIINGNLSEKSIYENSKVSVSLNQAVEGYWISENPNEGGFLVSDSNYKRVKLSLSEGKHYYINAEKGYLMLILVDTINKNYFTHIERLPIELL